MREILFRGKRIDSGEWVYGCLFQHDGIGTCIHSFDMFYETRTFLKGKLLSAQTELVRVDPSTVGQFTGLTDKDGKKIFEGDIISVEFEEDKEPELGEPAKWYECYTVTFDEEHHCWGTKISNREFGEWLFEYDDDCASVIGNIHDNPELLKIKK